VIPIFGREHVEVEGGHLKPEKFSHHKTTMLKHNHIDVQYNTTKENSQTMHMSLLSRFFLAMALGLHAHKKLRAFFFYNFLAGGINRSCRTML